MTQTLESEDGNVIPDSTQPPAISSRAFSDHGIVVTIALKWRRIPMALIKPIRGRESPPICGNRLRGTCTFVIGNLLYWGNAYFCGESIYVSHSNQRLRSRYADVSAFPQSDSNVAEFRNPQRIIRPSRRNLRRYFVAGGNNHRAHKQNLRSISQGRETSVCGILPALSRLVRARDATRLSRAVHNRQRL